MAINFNDNICVLGAKPTDSRYLNDLTPYTDVTAVNTAITESKRYLGLTVNVDGVEYWYGAGTGDGDLVIKDSGIASTGITAAANGLSKVGATVALGGTLTGDTTFTGSASAVLQYADDYSSGYDARSIVDADYASGGTASNGLTKTGRDIKLGGTTPLTETTNICGNSQTLNLGTFTDKIGAFTINANTAAILVDNSIQLCPTGALTLDAGSIAINTVAKYDAEKTYDALSLPSAGWVTGKTSQGFTTANNGLCASGQIVSLGGNLTGDTTIGGVGTHVFRVCDSNVNGSLYVGPTLASIATCQNSIYTNATDACISSSSGEGLRLTCTGNFILTFSGATITDNNETPDGLKYGACYSTGFTNDCSLVDKGYVDTEIGNIPSLTYNNGLCKLGDVVSLGGTLTGTTLINTNNTNSLTVASNSVYGLQVKSDGVVVLGDTSCTLGNSTFNNLGGISLNACTQGITLSANNTGWVNICAPNTCLRTLAGGCLDMNASSSVFTDADLKGIVYGGDYENNFTCRSLVTAKYVTGLTSGAFTNATNGLTGVAPDICLGGTLNTDTIINLNNGNCFQLCDNGLNTSYIFDNLGVFLCSQNSLFQITGNGNDYKFKHCSGRCVDLNSSGLTYGGDYSACFKANTLVTKNYVDNATGGIDANNGLDRQGNNVVLGGALTGATTISGSDTLTITSPFVTCCQSFIQFTEDSANIPTTPAEGMLYYSANTLNFVREYPDVVLQIGEESVTKVANNTTGLIEDGNVVYICGSDGSVPEIAKSIASDKEIARKSLGLVTADIADQANGFVTLRGSVGGLNTSTLTGVEGSSVYLSSTVAGGWTSTRPSYPNEVIHIGYLVVKDATAGKIEVAVNIETPYTTITEFTGYTATTKETLDNKLEIATFSGYTGTTQQTLSGIQQVTTRAITGATNGLCKYNSRSVCLGGALTSPTTISGNQPFTIGTSQNMCFATTTTKDIGINAKSNGGIYLKSQSGTVDGSDMTDAVGIALDFNSAAGMLVTDNRNVPRGLQYADDYTDTYLDRSLVDKYYVDSIATGLNVHGAVAVATTPAGGNLPLTGDTGNIDGYDVSGLTNNRILVKNQTDTSENGIYSASTGVWGRTDDYDFSPAGEIANGDLIPIISGTTNANSQWINTGVNPILSGESITFSVFSQQQGVTAGNGIEVNTVGTNREVSVRLSPSNPGLLFDATALELDYTVFTSGLTTSAVTGEVQVCASATSPEIGDEIYVKFASTDNSLVVDRADFSYTSAANGLCKIGCNVTLGGALTADTTVCGAGGAYDLSFTQLDSFALGFDNGAVITDNNAGTKRGICYAGDYRSGFVDLSLVDKRFVNNAITGTTLTYNNGVTKSGKVISWGGSLTGNTSILHGSGRICMSDIAGVSCVDLTAQNSTIRSTEGSAFMRSCVAATSLASICVGQAGTMALVADNATQGLTITSAAHGAVYAGDYENNFVKRSLVTAHFVTGLTSGIGAENGLTRDNNNNIVLGGVLTGTTTISGGSQTLNLGTTTSPLASLCGITSKIYAGNAGVSSKFDFELGEQPYFDLCMNDSGFTDYYGQLMICPVGNGYIDIYSEDFLTCAGSYFTSSGRIHSGENSWGGSAYNSGLTYTMWTRLHTTSQHTCQVIEDSSNSASNIKYNIDYADRSFDFSVNNTSVLTILSGGTARYGIATTAGAITNNADLTNKAYVDNAISTGAVTAGSGLTCNAGAFDVNAIGTPTGTCLDVGIIGNNLVIGSNEISAAIAQTSPTSSLLISAYDNAGSIVIQAEDIASCIALASPTGACIDVYDGGSGLLVIQESDIQSVLTFENGLDGTTTSGTVCLGGALTTNTTICLNSSDINIGDSSIDSTYISTFYNVGSQPFVEIGACNMGSDWSTLTVRNDKIEAYTENSSTFCGFSYVNGFASTVGDMQGCSIPDVDWVTGCTSTMISTSTNTFTNGLCKNGTTVCLGGTLTQPTILSGTTANHLKYGDDYSDGFGLDSIPDWRSIVTVKVQNETGSFQLDGDELGEAVIVTSTSESIVTIPADATYEFPIGSMITIQQGGAGIVTISGASGVDVSGVALSTTQQYGFVQLWKTAADTWTVVGGNIELWETSGATILKPVDVAYSVPVEYISGLSGALSNTVTGSTNGLSIDNQVVKLGGAVLIEETIISGGSQTFSLTGASNINLGATIVDITGAVTMSSTLNVTGNTSIGANTSIGGTLSVTGAVDTTTTLGVGGALTLSSVGAGSATDNVLTITSGGVVESISSSSLGEDNNVYSMTVVTTDVTLTTGSSYVQLINSPTSGITVTLPATPIDGQVLRIKDAAGAALTYPITIARNTKLIDGGMNDGILNTDSGALELVYNDSLGSWFVFSFVN